MSRNMILISLLGLIALLLIFGSGCAKSQGVQDQTKDIINSQSQNIQEQTKNISNSNSKTVVLNVRGIT